MALRSSRLPIFVVRRFHHSGLLVRPDAGIKTPKDLEGKKVGVRAYSVTTGVWTRQVLIDEFGLDSSKVTWVVDDEEHVTQLKLPSNVIHAPAGSSLADMMAKGELVGGIWRQRRHWPHGRADGRLEGSRGRLSRSLPECGRTGGRVLRPHRRLSDARHHRRQGLGAGRASVGGQVDLRRFRSAPRRNGWPVSMRAKLTDKPATRSISSCARSSATIRCPTVWRRTCKTIEALEATAFKQGLTPRRMSMSELFVDPLRV